MTRLRRLVLAPYHFLWAFLSAWWYGFPARKLTVIGVTGTKGKSSVAEMLFHVLSATGHSTALAGTIRFAVGPDSKPNIYKMTLPGRGFIQKFLAEAVTKGCTHAVIEITSEAAVQYRHHYLYLDGLIVTNIKPEHIESHGSFEKYVAAKRKIVEALIASSKKSRVLVANADIPETKAFLTLGVPHSFGFSESELHECTSDERSVQFTYEGTSFSVPMPGTFSAINALAVIKLSNAFGVSLLESARSLATLPIIRGRVEHIDEGQDFLAVVDYAHTPDSLKAFYSAFRNKRKICVLGNTGGGRDAWKRPEMGRIAEASCDVVILTNEDPYDEDPLNILAEMQKGMERVPEVILDRREAIRAALLAARSGDAVLISGKGTDPFIMGPRGSKQPWSDAQVVREEIARLLAKV